MDGAERGSHVVYIIVFSKFHPITELSGVGISFCAHGGKRSSTWYMSFFLMLFIIQQLRPQVIVIH
jgi:hypothetical protein